MWRRARDAAGAPALVHTPVLDAGCATGGRATAGRVTPALNHSPDLSRDSARTVRLCPVLTEAEHKSLCGAGTTRRRSAVL